MRQMAGVLRGVSFFSAVWDVQDLLETEDQDFVTNNKEVSYSFTENGQGLVSEISLNQWLLRVLFLLFPEPRVGRYSGEEFISCCISTP